MLVTQKTTNELACPGRPPGECSHMKIFKHPSALAVIALLATAVGLGAPATADDRIFPVKKSDYDSYIVVLD